MIIKGINVRKYDENVKTNINIDKIYKQYFDKINKRDDVFEDFYDKLNPEIKDVIDLFYSQNGISLDNIYFLNEKISN